MAVGQICQLPIRFDLVFEHCGSDSLTLIDEIDNRRGRTVLAQAVNRVRTGTASRWILTKRCFCDAAMGVVFSHLVRLVSEK